MAANDPYPHSRPPLSGGGESMSTAALAEHLEEEIGRAERHGTQLSCLLVVIDNLEALAAEHGSALPRETLEYVAAALRGELRRFDRVGMPGAGELLVVLPGADSPLGEIVARRLLERIHTIKVEARGERRPLEISVGLEAWRAGMSGAELLARTRAAARRQNGEDTPPLGGGAERTTVTEAARGAAQRRRGSHPSVLPGPAPS